MAGEEKKGFAFDFPPAGGVNTPFPPAGGVNTPFPKPAAVAAGPEAASAKQPNPEPLSDDEAEETTVSFGTKIARAPINKFRGVKDYNKRVAVIHTAIYAVKSHYDESIGSFRCFGTVCCEDADPTVRYLIPVLVYDTNREGQPVSQRFEIEYMALGGSYYDSLATLHKVSPLTQTDLIVQCSDEKYQKNTYMPAGNALWKTNEAFAKQVVERYEKLKKYIPRSFARNLGKTVPECEATYKRLKGIVAPANLADGGGSLFDLGKVV